MGGVCCRPERRPAATSGSTTAVIAKSKQTDGEDETQVISTAKKSIRVESVRTKTKGKSNNSTAVSSSASTTATATSATTVINSIVTPSSGTTSVNSNTMVTSNTTATTVEPEVAAGRRSGRHQTPTPNTPATRPPSARQATPTRQIVPGSTAAASASTVTTKQAANVAKQAAG